MEKKKIGILGATSYTGAELLRLLAHHPLLELSFRRLRSAQRRTARCRLS